MLKITPATSVQNLRCNVSHLILNHIFRSAAVAQCAGVSPTAVIANAAHRSGGLANLWCLFPRLCRLVIPLLFEFQGRRLAIVHAVGLIIAVLSIVSRNKNMSNLGVSNSTNTNWGNQDCTARGATSVTVIIVVLSGIGVCFYVRTRIRVCIQLVHSFLDFAFHSSIPNLLVICYEYIISTRCNDSLSLRRPWYLLLAPTRTLLACDFPCTRTVTCRPQPATLAPNPFAHPELTLPALSPHRGRQPRIRASTCPSASAPAAATPSGLREQLQIPNVEGE